MRNSEGCRRRGFLEGGEEEKGVGREREGKGRG
jgi:hypothetical protein